MPLLIRLRRAAASAFVSHLRGEQMANALATINFISLRGFSSDKSLDDNPPPGRVEQHVQGRKEESWASKPASSLARNDDTFDFAAGFDREESRPVRRRHLLSSPSTSQPPSTFAPSNQDQEPFQEASAFPADGAGPRFDGGFLSSQAFYEAARRVHGLSENDLIRNFREEIEDGMGESEYLHRGGKEQRPRHGSSRLLGGNKASDGPPSPEDYMVLAEAIEAYLRVAPAMADYREDGVGPVDRAVLMALAQTIRHRYGDGGRELSLPAGLKLGSPLETPVVNAAPPGRLPWEILGVDETRAVVHWAADLTGGKAPDPWRNARLSDGAKTAMAIAHAEDPKTYSVAALAQEFRIRQQRVMAILALKELEKERDEALAKERNKSSASLKKVKSSNDKTAEDGGEEKGRSGVLTTGPLEKEAAMAAEVVSLLEDGVWRCTEARGSGEQHVVTMPSFPNYAEVSTETVISRLESALGKSADEITDEDITPELTQHVLGAKSPAVLEHEIAAKEERQLITEFRDALNYNMGKIAKGLERGSGHTTTPRRPKGGWSLLVTPLGSKGDHPFVAQPDGLQRPLGEDERVLVNRKTPRRRRRIM